MAGSIETGKKHKNNASSARGGSVSGIENREIARNHARGAAVAATAGIKIAKSVKTMPVVPAVEA